MSSLYELWGDSWLLRQAIAKVPRTVDLRGVAVALQNDQPGLAQLVALEAETRDHRADTTWWQQRAATALDELDRRHWAFALLSDAHQHVVVELVDELSEIVEELQPKHLRSLQAALRVIGTTRQLSLRDPLRLREVTLSPRTLWLAREVTTEDSVQQIERRLADGLGSLLQPGLGDLRELITSVPAIKTIKIDLLRGARAALPAGGWASTTRLGLIHAGLAWGILGNPHEWPADIVQRAAEVVTDRLATRTQPIAVIAAEDNWFAPL